MIEQLVSRNRIITGIAEIKRLIELIKSNSQDMSKFRYKIVKGNLKHSKKVLEEIENSWKYAKSLSQNDEEVTIDRMNRIGIEIDYLLDYLPKTLDMIKTLNNIYESFDTDIMMLGAYRKLERRDYSIKYQGSCPCWGPNG